MTDEELLADLYVQNDALFVNNKVTIKSIKQAYLAGLKAGRPKWHDLKKNPEDLPDNTDNVLSDKGVIVYYNFTHACWVDERASVEIDDVIAWCEIPEFEEEVKECRT